jgi:hypothetical protein
VTWTSWRLARPAAIGSGLLVVVLAAFLVFTAAHLQGAFGSTGLGACLAVSGSRSACFDQATEFYAVMNSLVGGKPVVTYITLVPGLLGGFIGGALLARELETGTVRLAWTQSVTATRWLAARVLVAGLVLTAAVVVLTAFTTYWRRPVDAVDGRFNPNGYNIEGIVPVGYALLAFAAGILAGALWRRTSAAIAVAVAVYVLVHVVIETQLRPRFLAPVTLTYGAEPPATLPSGSAGDWVLEQHMPRPGADLARYPYVTVYQPAGRFWEFQLIEFGIVVALATVFLVLAFGWVRRRRTA